MNAPRSLGPIFLAALLAACAAMQERAPAEATQALVAGGKMRVALNVTNPVLAKRDAKGEVSGITVDLARKVAARLGVEPAFVVYQNAGALLDGARKGEWDIGFTAVDAARMDVLAFAKPYMEVSVTYIVPSGSAIRRVDDADRDGLKIGVGERNTADLFLTRSLKHARLVRIPDTLPASVEMVKSGQVDAYAGNRERLLVIQEQIAGQRIVEGRFMAVQHAIAVPKPKEAAVPWLNSVVESAKRDGSIAASISRHALRGVEVAP
jgi:polar amino acid transport system substrate-binding protein